MVKKMTNNMSLKSLKISWWGQNSVAGHILLPSASGGSKKTVFLCEVFPYIHDEWLLSSSIYHQVIRGKEKTSINKLITMDCAVNIFSYLVLIFHHTPLFQLRFWTQCFEFYQIYWLFGSRANHLCYINSFLVFSLMAWSSVGKMKKVPS